MIISSMFESSALILTVITIGKYLEGTEQFKKFYLGKAKKTILTMQERIFPTDQLFRTTHCTYLEPKN